MPNDTNNTPNDLPHAECHDRVRIPPGTTMMSLHFESVESLLDDDGDDGHGGHNVGESHGVLRPVQHRRRWLGDGLVRETLHVVTPRVRSSPCHWTCASAV